MKIAMFAFVFLLLPGVPISGDAQVEIRNRGMQALTELSNSLRDLSASISLSVVQITGTGYGLDKDEEHAGANFLSRQRSTGSGIIVSSDGYIITNAHVVEGARSIQVKLNGRQPQQISLFDAKLIGKDSELDLALLKIETAGLKPLEMGNSQDLKQGQIVLAFGSPLGMDNSVSMGIISATARQLNEDDPRIFIQTDAPINPGNSGGPLVDIGGRVVGINTFILTKSGGSEGIGFAIPSNVIRYVYTSLRKYGSVRRAQIGIRPRTITAALGTALNLQPDTGVLVEDVLPEGPADKAGLQVGDVILSINGEALRNVRDLSLKLYEYAIGDRLRMQLLRNRERVQVEVSVTEKPTDMVALSDLVNPDKDIVPQLGILALDVDDNVRQLLPLRYSDGVLVAAFAGSPSFFGDPLREGDVIHAVNGRHVTSIETLRHELENVKSGQPIALQTERNGGLTFLVLEAN